MGGLGKTAFGFDSRHSTQVTKIGGFALPSYEFRCSKCNTTGTAQFAFSEQVFMLCEKCHLPMDRVYSAPGLIFKGDGWGGKP